ncbi:MAG: hypothetical protein O7E52_08890 [Candidatus Poribacteria bacterium]|nr:hypothetical protein [Candidatus Poribacteria bacterium]
MRDFDVFSNSESKCQTDVLLAQLEKICQENPYMREYAVAKLLKIPHALKDFQSIIADFESRLIKLGYFHLDEQPQMTREAIEEILQSHEQLQQYELVEADEAFCLVDPKTNQTTYVIHCYPRFTEQSQFWGWGIQFRHYNNPRLDISLDFSASRERKPPMMGLADTN